MICAKRYTCGFTLLEVIISIAILSVISVLTYSGFQLMVENDVRSRAYYDEEMQLHQAWRVITQDILHLRARPVRDQLGGQQGAFEVGVQGLIARFSRAGYAPSKLAPSGLIRVAYRLNSESALERLVWPVLDASTAAEPQIQTLVTKISGMSVESLETNNNFARVWPPLNTNTALNQTPKLIRVTIVDSEGIATSKTMPGLEMPNDVLAQSIQPTGELDGQINGNEADSTPPAPADDQNVQESQDVVE